MIRSLLIGLAAGQRSLTPLAAIAGAVRRDTLPADVTLPNWARGPLAAHAAVLLAAAEMAGDKMPSAPDRTSAAGVIGRFVTGAAAGAALAPANRRRLGAALGAGAAVASSYLGLALRRRAMARFGQAPTGFAEDAAVFALAWAAANA